MHKQIGGGACALCGALNTNKSTCPLNKDAKNPNIAKHPNSQLMTTLKQVAVAAPAPIQEAPVARAPSPAPIQEAPVARAAPVPARRMADGTVTDFPEIERFVQKINRDVLLDFHYPRIEFVLERYVNRFSDRDLSEFADAIIRACLKKIRVKYIPKFPIPSRQDTIKYMILSGLDYPIPEVLKATAMDIVDDTINFGLITVETENGLIEQVKDKGEIIETLKLRSSMACFGVKPQYAHQRCDDNYLLDIQAKQSLCKQVKDSLTIKSMRFIKNVLMRENFINTLVRIQDMSAPETFIFPKPPKGEEKFMDDFFREIETQKPFEINLKAVAYMFITYLILKDLDKPEAKKHCEFLKDFITNNCYIIATSAIHKLIQMHRYTASV